MFGSYLYSDLRQVNFESQLLSAVHVRVMRLLEGSLQLVQLEGGECCPVSTVFLFRVFIVGQFSVSVRGVWTHGGFCGAAGTTNTCGRRKVRKFQLQNHSQKEELIHFLCSSRKHCKFDTYFYSHFVR